MTHLERTGRIRHVCIYLFCISLWAGISPMQAQDVKSTRTLMIKLNGNNASEIATKLDGKVSGIEVNVLSPHLPLLTYSGEVPADNVKTVTDAITSLDGVPPELSSSRIIHLYNLKADARIAIPMSLAPGRHTMRRP